MFLCFVGIELVTLPFIVTFWTVLDPTQSEDSGVLEHVCHCLTGSRCYEQSCSPIIWAKSVYKEEPTLGILRGLISLLDEGDTILQTL